MKKIEELEKLKQLRLLLNDWYAMIGDSMYELAEITYYQIRKLIEEIKSE